MRPKLTTVIITILAVALCVALVNKIDFSKYHPIKEIKESHKFTVIDVDPPKRFYITVQDNETGVIYRHMYVSKRCAFYSTKVPIGSVWKFDLITKYYYDGRVVKEVDGYSNICQDSSKRIK
jgi:hypothetical protein